MINVNQITSQLARMPDQALQQYAMMHKNDPYTVSLALSESNRRKQMRDAAQGQQGMGEQPKVVDQGIAQMMAPPPQPQMPQAQAQPMPEDVGIGALPAPNMQGMAEGGIVAFGGGGDVQHFQAGGSLIGQMQAQGVSALQPLADQVRQAEQAYVAAAKSGDPAAISLYGKTLSDLKAKLAGSVETQFGNAAPAVMTQLTAPAVAAAPAVVIPSVQSTATLPAPTDKGPSAPAVKPPPADGGITTLAAAPRAAAPAVPEKDFMSQYEAARKDRKVTDPYAQEESDLAKAEEAAARKRLSSFETDVKEKGDVYAKREARIGKREGELEKSKDTNMGLAFLEAGLGMMQSKGRGLAGIAEGATVGVKSYAAGIDKLKTAQEKLDDARDKMEELRQNEASMDKRDRRSLEADIDKTVNQGKRAYLGAQRLLLNKDEALTQTAVASDVAAQGRREQMRSSERIAENTLTATASSPERQAYSAALQSTITKDKPKGDPVAAYQKLMELKREPISTEKLRTEWSDPMKRQQISTDYPNVKTFEDYMLVMGAGGGGGAGGGFKLVGVK
jgi:hypothetical protein